MSELEYRLVVRQGVSTIHRLPASEQCEVEDTDIGIMVDTSTGAHLIDKGEANACEHCFPDAA